MNDAQRAEYLDNVTAKADEFLDDAVARGEAFTEGLCSWAIDRALEIVPQP